MDSTNELLKNMKQVRITDRVTKSGKGYGGFLEIKKRIMAGKDNALPGTIENAMLFGTNMAYSFRGKLSLFLHRCVSSMFDDRHTVNVSIRFESYPVEISLSQKVDCLHAGFAVSKKAMEDIADLECNEILMAMVNPDLYAKDRS